MGGKTHQATGVLSFALVAGPLSQSWGIAPEVPATALALLAGVTAGSVSGLFPDIDEPNSMLGRGGWMSKQFPKLFRTLLMIVSLPIRALGYLLRGVLGHRGGTHSLFMALLVTFATGIPLALYFGPGSDWVLWVILLGYLSHLAGDMMTPHGVPFFWPLMSKNRCQHILPKALRIPTLSPKPDPREMILRKLTWLAVWLLLGYYYLYPLLQGLLG